MLSDYTGILIFLIICAGFAGVVIGLSYVVGRRTVSKEKLMPYECGLDPMDEPFRRLGPRVVPTFNYLQTAAMLYADGYIDRASVARVARSLADSAGYTADRLANSLADLCRRGHLGSTDQMAIRNDLAREGLITAIPPGGMVQRLRMRADAGLRALRWRRRSQGAVDTSSTVGPVDYDAVLGELDGPRRVRRGQ